MKRRTRARQWLHGFVAGIADILLLPVLLAACGLARLRRKPVHVGLGPEPMINNVYHKRALETAGYTAETFVTSVYYITREFDVHLYFRRRWAQLLVRLGHLDFLFVIFRYRCLYIYFNGGPLMNSGLLWRLEPFLLALAKVKVVTMPYGGDVQDLSRCPNLLFRHAMTIDYPQHWRQGPLIARKTRLWVKHADHVIAGCDWVDYLPHWDTLMVAHFSIDVERWRPEPGSLTAKRRTIRVLHAPNHRAIKGTGHFVSAIEELQSEGVGIELILLERVSNEVVKRAMRECDIVADQLVVGWYAMFAIEGMAMAKPLLCYLRPDLLELYRYSGLIGPDEPALVNCNPTNVKETLRWLAVDDAARYRIGQAGRRYVEKMHSIQAVGRAFRRINESIGLLPGAR